MKIYVASSWRNDHQQAVVAALREHGHEVYDFRQPTGPGSSGFSWKSVGSEIGNPEWLTWSVDEYLKALDHPISQKGFNLDYNALSSCDACVFVAPAGISASLEFGFACGTGKLTIVYLPDRLREPDLMFKMADYVETSMTSVLQYIEEHKAVLA